MNNYNLSFVNIIRATFVQNAIKYLRTYEFDGLDIDWVFTLFKRLINRLSLND